MESADFKKHKDLVTRGLAVLIREHDCAILPGFGALIGNYSPASFHPVSHLFHPPSKQLVFNRSLTTDDGLLNNRLSIRLSYSFSETRSWLALYCSELLKELNEGNSIEFSGIGSFKMTPEHTIRFTADETINYLPASFGFYVIQADPINRIPIPERRTEPDFQSREMRPVSQVKKKFFTKKAIRVGAVSFIAMLALINGTLPSGKGISTADLNPFSQQEPMTTGMSVQSRHVSAIGRKASQPVVESMNFSAEHARIFIVAGCYSTKENADGMVQYLTDKGFNSSILDRTPAGLFRVVYDSYDDLANASEELSTIRKGLNEEAWLLIR